MGLMDRSSLERERNSKPRWLVSLGSILYQGKASQKEASRHGASLPLSQRKSFLAPRLAGCCDWIVSGDNRGLPDWTQYSTRKYYFVVGSSFLHRQWSKAIVSGHALSSIIIIISCHTSGGTTSVNFVSRGGRGFPGIVAHCHLHCKT